MRHNYFVKDKLYYLFHRRFFCLIRRLKVTPTFTWLGEIRKSYIILGNLDRIIKSALIFLSYYFIESIRHNSFKDYKVHGKCIIVSLRAKFTRLLYLKLVSISLIKSFYFEFVQSICLSDIIQYFLTTPERKELFCGASYVP